MFWRLRHRKYRDLELGHGGKNDWNDLTNARTPGTQAGAAGLPI
jgi:hypothetical protein